jgi:hypothetical protein
MSLIIDHLDHRQLEGIASTALLATQTFGSQEQPSCQMTYLSAVVLFSVALPGQFATSTIKA